jgi:hypothetical protein
MKQDGKFQRFRDKWLTPRWFRYIVVPGLAGGPAALAGLWFAVHNGVRADYLLKGDSPWVFFATAAWAGFISILKSYLNDLAAQTIDSLKKAQEELTHLLGWVRIVVGSKSRRFHESLLAVTDSTTSGDAFLAITRPELQIKQLVQAIHGFFTISINPTKERVKVSLMRMNSGERHLEFADWFPDADHPRSAPENFNDARTIAGFAFFNRQIVISEDVWNDVRYQRLGDLEGGSMFAFPIIDDIVGQPVFVVNVVSTRIGRFKASDEASIRIAMDVFAERIVLENRLVQLRERVIRNSRGGRS